MKDNYTYPVILDYNEEGVINIIFPSFDFDVTCVERGEDPITEAQDWLALNIYDREESHSDIPLEIADNDNIEVKKKQKLVYVNIWMPYHRTKVKEVYVKKTLTIPVWLDKLAKSNNINFSACLVESIKNRLGIENM